MDATSRLLQQVAEKQVMAAQLSELSVQCGSEQLVLPELDKLAEDVELKHLLWSMQGEWAADAAAWLAAPFFGLDVADMQAKVGVQGPCSEAHYLHPSHMMTCIARSRHMVWR